MPDVFATGIARGSFAPRLIFLQPVGAADDTAVRCIAQRGVLRVAVERQPGEAHIHHGARALRQLHQLECIAETVEQTWSRCDGERPSEAHHWLAAGLDDSAVIAWLEVGVPWASAAAELRAVQLEPRDVAGEHADGVTLGLAFARRELTLAEVQRAALGEEVAC